MTREEIKDFCDIKSQFEPENEDIYKEIVKMIEQESTINKIRTEIAEHGSIRVAYVITDKTKTDKGIEELVTDVLSEAKRQILGIIDKYKSESEE